MGTIYDKKRKNNKLDALLNDTGTSQSNMDRIASSEQVPNNISVQETISQQSAVVERNHIELQEYSSKAIQALSMVDDIVTKGYLTRLSEMEIIPLSENEIGKNTILFKVNKMVYEKDEYATEKFINALGAMGYAECSVFLVLDGHKDRTDFYIGIRNNDPKRTDSSIAETFENSLKGQFPGIDLEKCSVPEHIGSLSVQQQLFNRVNHASSVSSCAGIPAYKTENGNYTNLTFIQGIEKLALAMQGKEYTAVILATNITGNALTAVRNGYEQIYTQMSAVATQQVSYSTNESLANAITRTKGTSVSISKTETLGVSHTDSTNNSFSTGTNWSHTDNKSESKQNAMGKIGQIGGGLTSAGIALAATGIGAPVGLAVMAIGGGLATIAGTLFGKTKTKGTSVTKGGSTTTTKGTGTSDTRTNSTSNGETQTESFSDSEGNTLTIGTSKNFALTVHNKHIEEILKQIDKQLERLAIAEGMGVWASGAYFLSYENDRDTAEIGAAIFKSIMQGEKSGVESSAINSWLDIAKPEQVKMLTTCITSFIHPTFVFENAQIGQQTLVNSSSLISTAELAMQMGLPRKSVPGFPVLEHISLGKEVVTQSGKEIFRPLKMGYIYDQGRAHSDTLVNLEAKSLTQHTFVTGSTGCGKSETVYRLISQAKKVGAKFLIIEPAKGEYKNVFGNANIFGSNPELTDLLRINPFRFPKGIHVLEHIDRLTEIFNVCWPMYAAMPAVLKKALVLSYEKAGWDLLRNSNKYDRFFPTFKDLLYELEEVIKESAYSEEVKGNYIGSLVTRVESLTNGLNAFIFGTDEISDSVLFDEDTVVDLSRIGSQETKALIMGVLIMRLNEYRMVNATDFNVGLKHLTVLEEAHNILKRTSTEQSQEGSNLAGKAVEMITNSIAEMRTYGEGFVIVDQSPTSVDPAAIKNTNTKFIMRLPDGDDRRIAGKSAGLKDSQLDEIAKLPTGVAVTYQNDWEEPVLCQISLCEEEPIKYKYTPKEIDDVPDYLDDVIQFLVSGRIPKKVDFDIDKVCHAKFSPRLTTLQKIELCKLICEYEERGNLMLWRNDHFSELAKFVTDLLGMRGAVIPMVHEAKSFEELDENLAEGVSKRLGNVPDCVNLIVRQSLMKDFSLKNKTCEEKYNLWFCKVRAKRKGLI